ncbi:enterochelin esterase domain-containing protein [Pseudomonas aeruginosa]
MDAERVLVTFLWRQQRPGDVRLLWPTPEVNTRRFEALAGSDVRYLSLPLRRDARVSYQLSADLPDLQQADRGTLRLALQAAARPDPLSRTPWPNSRALPRASRPRWCSSAAPLPRPGTSRARTCRAARWSASAIPARPWPTSAS